MGDDASVGSSVDGTHIRRLTFQRANDGSASWSPSGSKLAFQSNRGGDFRLNTGYALMDADGLHQRRLTYVQAEATAAQVPGTTTLSRSPT